MSLGNSPLAALIACCTSCAAASILRDRSNCSVIEVTPTPLNDVIWLSDGIEVNCCSSGVATADAEHQDSEHQQRGPNRPPDERFGNAHRRFSALLFAG